MTQFSEDIAESGVAFAEISSRAAAAGNLRRIQTAQGNIRAATDQINLEETTQRREIARSLAQYQGQQAAGRAFRGGGALGSDFAVADAATAQAADQAAIVEANAAAKEIAAIAANQPVLEDPILAAIEGGVQGINFGTQIAQALLEEAEIGSRQSSIQLHGDPGTPPTFQNFFTQYLDIPGLDFEELFGDFFGD
jgi:hypothetical protein